MLQTLVVKLIKSWASKELLIRILKAYAESTKTPIDDDAVGIVEALWDKDPEGLVEHSTDLVRHWTEKKNK